MFPFDNEDLNNIYKALTWSEDPITPFKNQDLENIYFAIINSGCTCAELNNGEGVPSSELGKDGDYYLNTLNGDIYKKTDTWAVIYHASSLDYTPVNKAGDTMTGALVLNSDATTPLQAVTFQQLQAWQTGLWDDRGSYTAGGANVYPSSGGSGTSGAILKGDIWTLAAAETYGGNLIPAGSTIRSLINTPGQTAGNWAIMMNGLGYTPISNSLLSAKILVGNSSNVAAAQTLTLNATGGTFGISNAGVLTMPDASGSTKGLLSSAKFTEFQNKQNALSLSGTGNRMLESDAAGAITATKEIVSAWITDVDIIALLQDNAMWTGNSYTGTTITGAHQGQMHYDGDHYYLMVTNSIPIRIARV